MKQINIQLNDPEAVIDFVKEAEKCDFNVNLQQGTSIVDGKSLLGVFSLELSESLTVLCYGENSSFMNALKKFAVAWN